MQPQRRIHPAHKHVGAWLDSRFRSATPQIDVDNDSHPAAGHCSCVDGMNQSTQAIITAHTVSILSNARSCGTTTTSDSALGSSIIRSSCILPGNSVVNSSRNGKVLAFYSSLVGCCCCCCHLLNATSSKHCSLAAPDFNQMERVSASWWQPQNVGGKIVPSRGRLFPSSCPMEKDLRPSPIFGQALDANLGPLQTS